MDSSYGWAHYHLNAHTDTFPPKPITSYYDTRQIDNGMTCRFFYTCPPLLRRISRRHAPRTRDNPAHMVTSNIPTKLPFPLDMRLHVFLFGQNNLNTLYFCKRIVLSFNWAVYILSQCVFIFDFFYPIYTIQYFQYLNRNGISARYIYIYIYIRVFYSVKINFKQCQSPIPV